jgi:2-dehydro-3-deoxyphosphogluconate aldolase / (4S)-4-hydroxy-2-oxoglutarate aldolase
MNRKQVCSLIEEIGIIPSIRTSSTQEARFAAEAVFEGGIPIAEITMTVPGAVRLIADLAKHAPEMVVGAGGVMDPETARLCLDAGAKFLTTDGVILEIVQYATAADVVVFPGALTPSEVLSAWRAGSDFVKVVPCAAAGGEKYLKAMQDSLAQVPLIAAGGVNLRTAPGYLSAGAVALGVGRALFPEEALTLRQSNRIRELARRFLKFVQNGRHEGAAKFEGRPSSGVREGTSESARVFHPLWTV